MVLSGFGLFGCFGLSGPATSSQFSFESFFDKINQLLFRLGRRFGAISFDLSPQLIVDPDRLIRLRRKFARWVCPDHFQHLVRSWPLTTRYGTKIKLSNALAIIPTKSLLIKTGNRQSFLVDFSDTALLDMGHKKRAAPVHSQDSPHMSVTFQGATECLGRKLPCRGNYVKISTTTLIRCIKKSRKQTPDIGRASTPSLIKTMISHTSEAIRPLSNMLSVLVAVSFAAPSRECAL